MNSEKKQRKDEVISDFKLLDRLPQVLLALCTSFLQLEEHQCVLRCSSTLLAAMMNPLSFPPRLLIRDICFFRWARTTKPMFSARTVSLALRGFPMEHNHPLPPAHDDQLFHPTNPRAKELQKEMQAAMFRSPVFRELKLELPWTCMANGSTGAASVYLANYFTGQPHPTTDRALICSFSQTAGHVVFIPGVPSGGGAPWRILQVCHTPDPIDLRLPAGIEELRLGPSMPLHYPPMPESRVDLKRLVIDFTGCGFGLGKELKGRLRGLCLTDLTVKCPDYYSFEHYTDQWHWELCKKQHPQCVVIDVDLVTTPKYKIAAADAILTGGIERLLLAMTQHDGPASFDLTVRMRPKQEPLLTVETLATWSSLPLVEGHTFCVKLIGGYEVVREFRSK